MEQQLFTYEQENVLEQLTVLEIDGEAWFVASDVCKLLGLENTTKAVSTLDDDEKKLTYPLVRAGQTRKFTLVNESGLYALIFKSTKTSAKAFRRWVTKEVLPQIRKTGSYGIDRTALPNFMKRYQLNWAKTDKGYFSVISMLYTTLYANLEKVGYTIPDRGTHNKEIRPDTSVGRLFSDYLKKHHPHLANKHKKYLHTFADGSEFECRQYENIVLPVFIEYVEDVWIPERSATYFAERDRKALDYLPKLIGSIV